MCIERRLSPRGLNTYRCAAHTTARQRVVVVVVLYIQQSQCYSRAVDADVEHVVCGGGGGGTWCACHPQRTHTHPHDTTGVVGVGVAVHTPLYLSCYMVGCTHERTSRCARSALRLQYESAGGWISNVERRNDAGVVNWKHLRAARRACCRRRNGNTLHVVGTYEGYAAAHTWKCAPK